METTGTQQHFFQHIKLLLPGNLSLADEVAEVLNISVDSAYRRIRGEKQISFDEIQKLCGHYKISLDQFLNLKSDTYIFSGLLKDTSENAFEKYLDNLLQNFQFFNSFSNRKMYVLLKDIPAFVHFQIPELAAFKLYFWMKSILFDEKLKTVKFSFDNPVFNKFLITAKRIRDLYQQIPTTEIWNIESINATLRQINFYHESGSFKNLADVKLLYTKVSELVNHIEKQAEYGVVFNMGEEPSKNAPEYKLFVNELILGDNTYLLELDGQQLTFLNHSVLYFIATKDEAFNRSMNNNLQNLIKKSTLISVVGEKERVRFFNRLRSKIQQRLNALE